MASLRLAMTLFLSGVPLSTGGQIIKSAETSKAPNQSGYKCVMFDIPQPRWYWGVVIAWRVTTCPQWTYPTSQSLTGTLPITTRVGPPEP